MEQIRKHKFILLLLVNIGVGIFVLGTPIVPFLHVTLLCLNYRLTDRICKMVVLDGALLLSHYGILAWTMYSFMQESTDPNAGIGVSWVLVFASIFIAIDLLTIWGIALRILFVKKKWKACWILGIPLMVILIVGGYVVIGGILGGIL